MVRNRGETVRFLDAGAGVGSLTAALVAELASREAPPRRIEAIAYELDPTLAKALAGTHSICREACNAVGIQFIGELAGSDFIEAASEEVAGGLFSTRSQFFDCAILNPPYRKMRTDSAERAWLQAAGLEATNLYTAFLFLAAKLLVPGGELVAITPRSFCNGPYHLPFRRAFLKMMRLERLHVFETRDTAFGEDGVLQENIIFRAVKSPDRSGHVQVTSNASPSDPDVEERAVPYDEVVDPTDSNCFVRVVPNEMNAVIARQMSQLQGALHNLGLTVSTGRVVDYRVKEYLRKNPENDTAPLIYPGHIVNGTVHWPRTGFRKSNAIVDSGQTASQMVPQGTYVLVKRFSAKEEPRRVVAAVIDAGDAPHPRWGFENHLNYFHERGRPLERDLARGLAAYLNTTLVDTYFRQFNGHTQVNAADLRSLPYPSREQLFALARRTGDSNRPQDDLDTLAEEVLKLADDDEAVDPVKGQKRLDEALSILRLLGLPGAQQNARSALTLLALLDIRPRSKWADASSPPRGITEMMDYFAMYYGKKYAPNSRETVRRYTVHQFVEAGFVTMNPDDATRAVNSPKAVYQIEPAALDLFRAFGSPSWSQKLARYLDAKPSLQARHAAVRDMERIPVTTSTGSLTLSPGGQNKLVKLVVEEFCPRYTPGGEVLYLGDAGAKWVSFDKDGFAALGVSVDAHGKMPDVVIYYRKKNWLLLIEAVTSHGPVNPKRMEDLKRLFKDSKAGLVFVTAFLSRAAMVKYLNDISWATEVWVADNPTHMIHFNGDRFLGPYE